MGFLIIYSPFLSPDISIGQMKSLLDYVFFEHRWTPGNKEFGLTNIGKKFIYMFFQGYRITIMTRDAVVEKTENGYTWTTKEQPILI